MKEFKIGPSDANQRLDKFLKKILINAPLSLIYKLNRKNNVKINRKKKAIDYILDDGDILQLYINDEEYSKLTKKKKENKPTNGNKLNPKTIIYEDEELLIINKDPGVLVHPGDFKTKDLSLIDMVQDYLGKKYNSLTFKPSLVHRIDKDTSGVIIIAKTKQSLLHMLDELQNNRIKKYYQAICLGTPKKPSGDIKYRLKRIENAKAENKVQVTSSGGQSAITKYKTLTNLGRYSLLECELITGRMHQIRVHLAEIGNPIIGDNTYGNKRENSYLKRTNGVNRQFLHAYRIIFKHPITKKQITVKAELKGDMNSFLDKLKS